MKKSRTHRFFGRFPLAVQAVSFGIVITLLVGWGLDQWLSKHFSDFASNEMSMELGRQLRSVRAEMENYKSRFRSFAYLIADSDNMISYMDDAAFTGKSEIITHRLIPAWLPPANRWRSILPTHFLLVDPQSRLREAYMPMYSPLLEKIKESLPAIIARSSHQIITTPFEEGVYFVTSVAVYNRANDQTGFLVMVREIDSHWMRLVFPLTGEDDLAVVYFSGVTKKVFAANTTAFIKVGDSIDDLREHFFIAGKGYEDYGSTEIALNLAVLVKKERAAAFGARILKEERFLRISLALSLSALLLIFALVLVKRIRSITLHASSFAKNRLSRDLETDQKGDELLILDETLSIFTQEINNALKAMEFRAEVLAELNKDLNREITERKKVEAELKVAKDEAVSANAAKSEFLANMSHEIRTPLNAITGYNELLNSIVTDPTQRNYLQSIKTACNNLLVLIKDILDLSKIEAGVLDIITAPTDLSMIFQEIKMIFEMEIKEKNLDLQIEISPSIPPFLLLDETRLRQVLLNLVGNAVKFTDSGFIKLKAQMAMNSSGHSHGDLIITVEDTGIGVNPRERAAVFGPFKQQDGQSDKKYGGVGLGLAICKRLVEKMKGSIELKSETGVGSKFTIILPGVAVSQEKPEKGNGNQLLLNDYLFENNLILVADDVDSNLAMISEVLAKLNLESVTAKNGNDAVALALEKKPSLILMDIKMPESNGIEATERLKSDPCTKTIPVIALSASLERDEIEDKNDLFDAWLTKPIQIEKVVSVLSYYLKPIKSPDKNRAIIAESVQNIGKLITANPELRSMMTNEILSIWESIKDSGRMHEIICFGERIKELGNNFNLNEIVIYGEQIIEAATNYDIPQVEKQVNVLLAIKDGNEF